MTLTDYPNGVSSFGLPVIGGQFITTGSIFFVDSNTGSNSYNGKDKDHPFSTLSYAVSKCTANKGDVVYAMPGHIESMSSSEALNVNKAGVKIIGIGHGYLRPRITFDTTVSANIAISSCDVTIENFVFDASTAAVNLTGLVRVNASDFTLLNCEAMLPTSEELVYGAVYMAATSDDRMTIDGLKVAASASSACDATYSVIHVGGGDGHKIINSFISISNLGSTLAAGVINLSSAATTGPQGVLIDNDIVVTTASSAGTCLINLTSGSGSGIISNCYLAHADDGEDTHIGGTEQLSEFGIFQVYVNNVLGERGFLFGSTYVSAT